MRVEVAVACLPNVDRRLLSLGTAVSCERRNISAIIRATGSGEARCSVNEQTMEGD